MSASTCPHRLIRSVQAAGTRSREVLCVHNMSLSPDLDQTATRTLPSQIDTSPGKTTAFSYSSSLSFSYFFTSPNPRPSYFPPASVSGSSTVKPDQRMFVWGECRFAHLVRTWSSFQHLWAHKVDHWFRWGHIFRTRCHSEPSVSVCWTTFRL